MHTRARRQMVAFEKSPDGVSHHVVGQFERVPHPYALLCVEGLGLLVGHGSRELFDLPRFAAVQDGQGVDAAQLGIIGELGAPELVARGGRHDAHDAQLVRAGKAGLVGSQDRIPQRSGFVRAGGGDDEDGLTGPLDVGDRSRHDHQ